MAILFPCGTTRRAAFGGRRCGFPRQFAHWLGMTEEIWPPCLKDKRSAVAVVNDSPVGRQSRDRAARRRLDFAKQKTGG
jgi:hypothetical protein